MSCGSHPSMCWPYGRRCRQPGPTPADRKRWKLCACSRALLCTASTSTIATCRRKLPRRARSTSARVATWARKSWSASAPGGRLTGSFANLSCTAPGLRHCLLTCAAMTSPWGGLRVLHRCRAPACRRFWRSVLSGSKYWNAIRRSPTTEGWQPRWPRHPAIARPLAQLSQLNRTLACRTRVRVQSALQKTIGKHHA